MYVIAYVTVIGYFLLAAISQRATTIPNTLGEWERVAVVFAVACACYVWGSIVGQTDMLETLRERGLIRPRRHE